ncbi:MAG TPA: hypothetical protein VIA98_11350 [Allosphingosinicella sp.]
MSPSLLELPTGPAFQLGKEDIETAFVLAAPGLKEVDAGRPAARDTGANLDRLIRYRIANAVETVMHGKDTMRDLETVREPENLSRLRLQLEGCPMIVALSMPAIAAVEAAGLEASYRHETHPGMKGMNNLFQGMGLERKRRGWRVEERCRLYAEQLIASRTRT